jgi:SAM-dependent methyltransferase
VNRLLCFLKQDLKEIKGLFTRFLNILNVCALMSCMAAFASEPKINQARLLLATLRGGNYAHVGEKEATQIVIKRVLELSPGIEKGHCLDVGSGFGGTANDVYQMGFTSIQGIDIDEAAVRYAQQHYPYIAFMQADASNMPHLFEPFSLIYLFNVIYAIEDKSLLLKKLHGAAETGAILAIFDYTAKEATFELHDLATKLMYPIVLDSFQESLKASGWEVIEIVDLSEKYLIWYRNLLDKLAKEHHSLSQQFSQTDINRVHNTFSSLVEQLESASLGGTVIYCRKAN